MANKEDRLEKEKREGLRKKKRRGMLPFIFIMIAVVSSIAFVVIFSFTSFYNRAKNDARELGSTILLEKSQSFMGYIDKAKVALEAAAVAVEDEMRKAIGYGGLQSVFVAETELIQGDIDPYFSGIYGVVNGDYHDGTNWVPTEGFIPTERPWYKAALEYDGQIVMIPPYIDAQTGDFCITFAKSLYDKKSVVSFDVYMNMLQEMVSEVKISGNGYAFLTTHDGNVIAHSDRNELGKDYSQDEKMSGLIQIAEDTGSSSFETMIDGEECTVFTTITQDDWHVFLIVKNSDLYAGVRGVFYRDLIVFVLISALVVVLGSIAIRYSMKQLEAEDDLIKKAEIAERSNQMKNVFLSSMSHEIRTPINSILGMNEMIERESTEKNIISYSENIESAGNMLLAIVNNILDFSKIESGSIELMDKPYQTASLMNDLAEYLKEKVKAKKLSVFIDIDENIPSYLSGDQTRLRQVIINLLSNALKYTEKGSITFSAKGRALSEDRYLLSVTVADTGVGIDMDELNKLFSSFEKSESSVEGHVQGVGLGLAVVKCLVDAMGGKVSVESEPQKGSAFTIEIPQGVSDRTPVGPVAKEAEKSAEEKIELKKRPLFEAPEATILTVDDNEINLAVFCALLKRTKIKIDTASGGGQAIDMSKAKKYDLIFMDHMMPDPDGIETLHTIRNDVDNPNQDTPEVALTANAVAGAEKMYLDEGFDAYLTKPVDPKKIEKLIKDMLPAEKIIVSNDL